jgi:hypothetical protein
MTDTTLLEDLHAQIKADIGDEFNDEDNKFPANTKDMLYQKYGVVPPKFTNNGVFDASLIDPIVAE